MARVPHDADRYSYNKVLVFNLGFDRKGPERHHWIYFPSPDQVFYRIGFYDNIRTLFSKTAARFSLWTRRLSLEAIPLRRRAGSTGR